MSVAEGRPPFLTNEMVSQIVCKYFNFKSVHPTSIKSFPSYRDRTYYFQGEHADENDHEFILKISNPYSTPSEVIQGVNDVMKHLHSHGLKSPYPMPTRAGDDFISLTSNQLVPGSCTGTEKLSYHVCVLSFIAGKVFDHVDKKYLTPILMHEVGELLGKMDKELMENFSSKALGMRKNQDWDLMHFLDMQKYLDDIDDPANRRNAEKIFESFKYFVVPNIPKFKKGVIHGDLNGLNIILKGDHLMEDSYHLAGMIDFNDCVETCTIFDLGISLPYIMFENLNPIGCSNSVEFVGPLIAGYNDVMPLSAEELDSLYYLVLARCCQTALNGTRSFKIEPWNGYLLTTPQKAWILIDRLLEMTKEEVDKVWKDHINAIFIQ